MKSIFNLAIFIILNTFFVLNVTNGASITDIVSIGKDVAGGIVKNVPDILPSPEEFFQLSKNAIAGYPLKYASSAINQICSTALSVEAIKPKILPDVNNMTFLLMTPSKNYSFPLKNAEEMWKSPAFDKNKPTVIFVTGWTTDLSEENNAIYTMSNAYFCRGNVNFVVVDTARFVDTLYTWSAFNTEELGSYIGQGLVLFAKYADVNSIHLIGHSLGAHIVGAAGRTFEYQTNILLKRITGLDPAKPCFNEGQVLSGLQRGDAEFIDVIHSNPGVLGKADPTGDADFYAGGLNPLPNGCISVSCAHARAWKYYAETVLPGNENNFMGIKCTSLKSLNDNKCPGKSVTMGYKASPNARGNYFLDVNNESPYGKNGSKNSDIKKCIESQQGSEGSKQNNQKNQQKN